MSWIKMRDNLDTDPDVITIAAHLNISRFEAIGHLWKIWTWADQHSLTGNAMRVTNVTLDEIANRAGLAEAMRAVGWLDGEDFNLCFPNFERHNGQTAKTRALTAARVGRLRNAKSVTHVTPDALAEKIREEKIREEKNKRAQSESNVPVTPEPLLSGNAKSVTHVTPEALPTFGVQHAEAQLALRNIAKVKWNEEIGLWGQVPIYDHLLNEALERPIPRIQFEAMVWWYSLPADDEVFQKNHPAWDRQVTSFQNLLVNLRRECQKAAEVRKKMEASLGDIDPIQ